jgi:2-oxoglutarate ferredoxin oxidoreductase subunit gamma
MKRKKRISRKRTLRVPRCEEVLSAGFGGQGIMFMGKLLAQAALSEGKHVTWMPSYGAEVRGGTAHSMTKISDEYIASPVVTRPSICVVMNHPSLVKYEDQVCEGGLLVANRSLIHRVPKRKGIDVLAIPVTDIASKLGNVRVANMVALGALVKRRGVVSKRSVLDALREMMAGKEGLLKLNKKAFEKGYALVRGSRR